MIPTFDKFLFPVLYILRDGKEHSLKNLMEDVIHYFSLSETDIEEKVSSGTETKLHNRTQWATTYLGKAGLLQRPKRGICIITDDGKKLLDIGLTDITPKYLGDNYPSFAAFAKGYKNKNEQDNTIIVQQAKTPSEVMDEAFKEINSNLADELLEHVKNQSPKFFEQLVIKLLIAMGYGGSLDDGIRTQTSHDDGIDGIIKEDKLGLDNIFIQAKRYTTGAVQKPDIQKFIGALTEQGASKGVFITTTSFSTGAIETSKKASGVKIVLVNGDMLTKLMIENNIGVSLKQTYEIKRIDTDFFNEE